MIGDLYSQNRLPPQRGRLLVRCPHCQNSIESVEAAAFSDVECPACGNRFGLLGIESTATYRSPVNAAPLAAKIAHFEFIEQVGMGSFGSVWKARDTRLDRTVAIKIPRRGDLDVAETEQFLREARAAAQIRHPNIVGVHEVGRCEDSVYIVSDFVEGPTLKGWLTDQRLAPRDAAKLCVRICRGLHAAHEAGVVHRDLKPGNIMLDAQGEPHIADFGLAKRETGEVTMTMDGKVLGTPAYMSPEQARGKGHEADRRSDIYSAGVILYELLTGELPFRGESRMLIVQILRDEPASPRKLNGHIPRDLETICLKCLEKDAVRRYSTACAMADDLQRYLNGETIHARPASGLERGWRWCRRNPVVSSLAAAFTAAILTGLIGVTWQWLRAEQNSQTATRLAGQYQWSLKQELVRRKRAEDEYPLIRQNLVTALTAPELKQCQQAVLDAMNGIDGLIEELGKPPPDDLDWQHSEGCLLLQLGKITEIDGLPKEAEAAYRRAAEIFGRLGDARPGVREYQEFLAESGIWLGILCQNTARPQEAEAAYRQALQTFVRLASENPDVPEYQNALAILQLVLDDSNGYRRTCREMLGRFGTSQSRKIADLTVRTCVLAPNSVDDYRQILELAGEVVKDDQAADQFRAGALGAALYRAGEFDAAVERLTLSIRGQGSQGEAWDLLFLAMSKQQLGLDDEARGCLHQALPHLDDGLSDWREQLELKVLSRETQAMLDEAASRLEQLSHLDGEAG